MNVLNVPKIQVTVVALEGVMAYTLTGPFDVFSSLGECWEGVTGDKPTTLFEVSLVGLTVGSVGTFNSIALECTEVYSDVEATDLIIIPSVALDENEKYSVDEKFYAWLRRCYANGAVIASVCTGSFILADAGLLDDRLATTHWAYSAQFRKHYPDVRIQTDQMLTDDCGLVCAGGSASWQYLTSYLLEKLGGREVARQANRFFLLSANVGKQTPSVPLAAPLSQTDVSIRTAQTWMQANMSSANLLQSAVENSGLTERTFKRRFKSATGQTPVEYLQNIRIEKAKHLLENRNNTIVAVLEEIGYSEGSYFRRLFKRKVGITANDYRRGFGAPSVPSSGHSR